MEHKGVYFLLGIEFNLAISYSKESKPEQTWNATRFAQTSPTVTDKGRVLSRLVLSNKNKFKSVSIHVSVRQVLRRHTIFSALAKEKSFRQRGHCESHLWRKGWSVTGQGSGGNPGTDWGWVYMRSSLWALFWNRICLNACKLTIVCHVVLLSGPLDGWYILKQRKSFFSTSRSDIWVCVCVGGGLSAQHVGISSGLHGEGKHAQACHY